MSRPSTSTLLWSALIAITLSACGSSADPAGGPTGTDAGVPSEAGDASATDDASDAPDDAETDAGPDGSADAAHDVAADAHEDAPAEGGEDVSPDAGVPLDGMGALTGACGVLDDGEWNASAPFSFRNSVDFGTAGFVEAELSAGGAKILADGNLNEGSLKSEIVAYEALYRCELAALLKTENEVSYFDANGKRTDVLVEIDGRKVGVSITRAFHYPPTNPYTVPEAIDLLQKKLSDLPLSAANATAQDAWTRSMLHVVAYDDQYADAVESAWSQLDPSIAADYILMITVTDGEDAFVY